MPIPNKKLRAFLYTLIVLLSANQLAAIPVTYYWFSDTALYNDSGSGSFAFDIEAPLGAYMATDVSGGGGDKTGTWTDVKFEAIRSYLPTLTIYGVQGSQAYSFMSTTGGGVNRYSSADVEWEHFIAQAALNHITITTDPAGGPLANGVPEGSLPGLLSGLFFAGLCVIRRFWRK